MMSTGALARFDQDKAELVMLVRAAREHAEAQVCDMGDFCPGAAVAHVVMHEVAGREAKRLLLLAVARLAQLGYAVPTADELAYELTDHGQAALDECDGGDRA